MRQLSLGLARETVDAAEGSQTEEQHKRQERALTDNVTRKIRPRCES
jgi:hypothetical protein